MKFSHVWYVVDEKDWIGLDCFIHPCIQALPALPRFVGYTANLNVDYRKPLKAGQWVVLKSRLNRVEGRKAYVEAWVESADGQTKFTEAKSLYVGPKMPF